MCGLSVSHPCPFPPLGREIGNPVDLLYIDGDHRFHGIYQDFHAWIRLYAPVAWLFSMTTIHPSGAAWPIWGSGPADAILEKGLLSDVRHRYKMLSGRIPGQHVEAVGHQDCFRAFLRIGSAVRDVCGELFRHSIQEGMEALRHRLIPFSSLSACYAVAWALERDFECLDAMACSFHEFRHWTEVLSTSEHALGKSRFPWDAESMDVPEEAEELSKAVAAEQVRLVSLSRILEALVGWKP
jgi:hypothetical protein